MPDQPPPLPSPPGARLARIGLWLQLAPLIGIGETVRQVWPLIRKFYAEAATGGMPSLELVTRWAETLTQAVHAAMASSMIGTFVSFIGVAMILVAFVKHRYRPAWVVWFLAASLFLALLTLGMMMIPSPLPKAP
jgi:hypothetical protein